MKNVKVKYIIGKVITFLLLAALTAGVVKIVYDTLNNETTDIVTSYISEMTAHDMKNVRAYVSDRWTKLDGIARSIRARKCADINAVMSELGYNMLCDDIDRLYIMDDEGNLYSNFRTVYPKDENYFWSFFNDDSDKIARRYEDDGHYSSGLNAYMLYGLSFWDNPIVTEDKSVRLVAVIMLNDITRIRTRLRISSFNDRGYSSVINKLGQYIVTEDGVTTHGTYRNFFDTLSAGIVEDGNAEDIIEQIKKDKPVSFWYDNGKGSKRFVSVRPIPNLQWLFVTSLEKSIFTDQIQQFIQVQTLVIISLIVVIAAVFFVVYRTRKKLKTIYAGIVPGVYNRKYYNEKMVKKHVKALAILDLDKLKYINDTFGHLAGDAAIKEMANVLLQNVNPGTDVCRFGGDEFLIAFYDNTSAEDFKRRLNNIVDDIHSVKLEDYPDIKLTLSIGGCYSSGKTEDVLQRADMLLYEAKKKRDRIITNIDGKK